MAQVVPRQLVNNLLALTPEELRTLGLQLVSQRYIEADPMITRYRTGTIVASTNIIHTIDPPEDTEWLLYLVQVLDVQAIDPADVVSLFYGDNKSGYTILVRGRGALSQGTDNVLTWPLTSWTSSSNYHAMTLATPLILHRQPNKESGLNFQANFITTATVGNRNFEIRLLVRTRHPLH